MKKRILKPRVIKTLEIINIVLGIMFLSLDDFELKSIPWLFVYGSIFYFNWKVMKKYGSRELL